MASRACNRATGPRTVPSWPWAFALAPLYNTQQRFSKWGPEATSNRTTWNLLEKQILGLSPGPAEPEILGVPAWQACFSSDIPREV